jgi:hypothetical protein
MAAAHAGTTAPSDCVNFVNKDNAWGVLFSLGE